MDQNISYFLTYWSLFFNVVRDYFLPYYGTIMGHFTELFYRLRSSTKKNLDFLNDLCSWIVTSENKIWIFQTVFAPWSFRFGIIGKNIILIIIYTTTHLYRIYRPIYTEYIDPFIPKKRTRGCLFLPRFQILLYHIHDFYVLNLMCIQMLTLE